MIFAITVVEFGLILIYRNDYLAHDVLNVISESVSNSNPAFLFSLFFTLNVE